MANLKNALEVDPTLEACDRALEAKATLEERREYLGMSEIGHSCSRRLWYSFRWAYREGFDALTLKRFADGHRSEDLQAERLRLLPCIQLDTVHPVTLQQFRYTDHDGHFSGHCDGKILGILQAPKKKHIWEAKAVGEKKLTEFRKIKAELGEKNTLKKWNPVYYAQGMLYIHYEGTDRHYMTVSSPGVRDWDSCRTNADTPYAVSLVAKAGRIIKSDAPLEKISERPDWYECRFCPAKAICHGDEMPHRTCRTCLHSTPVANGAWHCDRLGKILTKKEQEDGCPLHKFLPSLVPGEVITATDTAVHYRMSDGSTWIDAEEGTRHGRAV